ncbi:protein-disulfide reductase DsbD [Permianibacter sp. IMCC34836]|uniref:protein-disulfide reductase DsbD n=1 Tax=Permianibacter fluminis TaxID=2738515 RepID=UPI0015519360|nr:protein-disulfide reductase DsbD [Permianibacter fluminis]NQD35466.1 protein-disulfide reductase DsbD [Permianibacter fluminis]
MKAVLFAIGRRLAGLLPVRARTPLTSKIVLSCASASTGKAARRFSLPTFGKRRAQAWRVIAEQQRLRFGLLTIATLIALCALFLAPPPAHAASASELLRAAADNGQNEEFLKVDQAFQAEVSRLDNDILIRFTIAPGYYLYRDQFRFKADGATFAAPQFPDGKLKHDEFLGEQIVYFKFAEIRLPIAQASGDFELKMTFQGCAEAGLCYPPTTRKFSITGAAVGNAAVGASDSTNSATASELIQTTETAASASASTSASTPIAGAAAGGDLAAALGGNLLLAMAIAFGAGLLLTFTPCVLPMIPITVAVIGGQGAQLSTGRRFALVFVYVQAMALTYAALGLAVASAGAALQGYLQSAWLIVPSAVLFVLLALSMFGAYELQLPAAVRDRLAQSSAGSSGGSITGVALMGALSALIVSPCISAPLAGALAYIAQTGESLRGGLALYALGLGMGLPLLIAGVGGGQLLPRAGAWMDNVKHLFGFGLIAVSIVLVNRLIPASAGLLLWALFALAFSAYFARLQTHSAWQYLLQALRYGALVYGIALVIGALAGQTNPLKPLPSFASAGAAAETNRKVDAHAGFKRIKSIADLERELAAANAAGKTVMLDFFADWCVACFEFADYTFPDPAVQKALANTVLLQADVTANDDTDLALMAKFNILGLPSILFFDRNGNELAGTRVTGFMKAEAFAQHVSTRLN